MSAPNETAAPVEVRPAQDCRFDEVSLGEIMLRLDPGDNRIRTKALDSLTPNLC